jgi:toxin ParE1/3/4
MKVVIAEAAWDDMLHIGQNIQEDNPGRAESFVSELYDRCQALGTHPRAFPLLPGREDSGIRRCVCGNYLIFYRTADTAVEVLRVIHGARDYDRILFRGD